MIADHDQGLCSVVEVNALSRMDTNKTFGIRRNGTNRSVNIKQAQQKSGHLFKCSLLKTRLLCYPDWQLLILRICWRTYFSTSGSTWKIIQLVSAADKAT